MDEDLKVKNRSRVFFTILKLAKTSVLDHLWKFPISASKNQAISTNFEIFRIKQPRKALEMLVWIEEARNNFKLFQKKVVGCKTTSLN